MLVCTDVTVGGVSKVLPATCAVVDFPLRPTARPVQFCTHSSSFVESFSES